MIEQDRFQMVHRQSGSFVDPAMRIWMDRKTGVQYLIVMNGNQAAGVTVLLDRDGKPLLAGGYDRG